MHIDQKNEISTKICRRTIQEGMGGLRKREAQPSLCFFMLNPAYWRNVRSLWGQRLEAAPSGELPGNNSPIIRSGTRIADRFVIAGLIGRGAYADVYEASDTNSSEAKVVVKIFRHWPGKHEYLENVFVRERRALELKLNGFPHLLEYGFLDNTSSLFLVMSKLPGRTLEEYRKSNKHVPVWQVLDIGHQLLGLLSSLHAKDVIHRDVKPANVLIDHNGHVGLCDLGTAISINHEDRRRGADLEGTPLYMAPEQIDGKPEVGSDLYALGLLLVELITGYHPMDPHGNEINYWIILQRHLWQPIGSIHPGRFRIRLSNPVLPNRSTGELIINFSDGLNRVLGKMIAKKIGDRFPTAAEAGQALEAVMAAWEPLVQFEKCWQNEERAAVCLQAWLTKDVL